MNERDFKMYLKSLYLDNNKYYVIGSGVLLMYGILDEINDIDLLVSSEVFSDLKKVFNISQSEKFPYVYKVNDKLSICEGIIRKEDYRLIECVPVKNITDQYLWYLNSKRDKDKDKILILSKYMERR